MQRPRRLLSFAILLIALLATCSQVGWVGHARGPISSPVPTHGHAISSPVGVLGPISVAPASSGQTVAQSASFLTAATGPATCPSWLTCTGARASTSYLKTSPSTLATLSIGVLGVGQPADSTTRGLRVMRGATNQLATPNTFPGSWTIDGGITRTGGATGPDATASAQHWVVPSSTQAYQMLSLPAGVYAFSVWAQANGGTSFVADWYDGGTTFFLGTAGNVTSSWAELDYPIATSPVYIKLVTGYSTVGALDVNQAFAMLEPTYCTTYDPATRASEGPTATGLVHAGRIALEIDFVPVWGTSQLGTANDANAYRYLWSIDPSNYCRLDGASLQIVCAVGGVQGWFPIAVSWSAFDHITLHVEAGNGYGRAWYTDNGGSQIQLGTAGVNAASLSASTVYLATDPTPANAIDAYIQAIRVYSGTSGAAPSGVPAMFEPQFVFDTAVSASITQDGSHNVSALADARGSLYPVTLTTSGATRPVYDSASTVDGHPAIDFSSTGASILNALHGSAAIGAQPWSVMIVSQATNPQTTIASGSNGQTLPQSTIYLASTAGFPASGAAYFDDQTVMVTYTSITGGATPSLNGCAGNNSGATLVTGGVVKSQPISGATFAMIGGTRFYTSGALPSVGISAYTDAVASFQDGAHEASPLAISVAGGCTGGLGYGCGIGRTSVVLNWMANALQLDTTAVHARLATWDGGSYRLWVDGTQLAQYDSSNAGYVSTSLLSGELSIGGELDSAFSTTGTIDQRVYYGWFQTGRALSSADVANAFRDVATRFPTSLGASGPGGRRLIIQGNSRDLGYPDEPFGGWPYLAVAVTAHTWEIRDYSINGQAIGYTGEEADGGTPTDYTFLFGNGLSGSPSTTSSAQWSSLWDVTPMRSANVVTSGGDDHSDLCAYSLQSPGADPNLLASTAHAFLATAVSQAHAAGAKFMVLTTTKDCICGANYEPARLAYEALVQADLAGADALVDVGIDSHFQTACDGVYLRTDGHPTPLGQQVIASLVVPALNAMAP